MTAKIKELERSLDIKDQYKLYLLLSGQDEEIMNKVQKDETKKAFYAGFAQMHILMKNEIVDMEEKKAVSCLESIEKQIAQFWRQK